MPRKVNNKGCRALVEINLWTGAIESRHFVFCPHCRLLHDLVPRMTPGPQVCQAAQCGKRFNVALFASGRAISSVPYDKGVA